MRFIGLTAVGIKRCLNTALEVTNTEIWSKRLADALIHIASNLLFKRRGQKSSTIRSLSRRCKQTTIGIENRNGRSIQRWHSGSNQLADRLRGFSGKAAFSADHNRGRWLLITATERAFFGHDDVNARSFYATNGLNGTRDLAFKCPNMRDFLHERCQAKRAHIVEKLVTGVV